MKDFPPVDGAPTRSTDPVTSHIAAALVPSGMLEKMFVEALEVNKSLTTTEVARMYQMERDSFSPRPDALKRKKLIVQDGFRWVPNKAGRVTKMIAFRLRRETDTSSDMTPPEFKRVTRKMLKARIKILEDAMRSIIELSDNLTDGDVLIEVIDTMDDIARVALEP